MDVLGSLQPIQNNAPLGSNTVQRVSDIPQTKASLQSSTDSDENKESQKVAEKVQQTQDDALLRDLRARDREVRSHEAAHMAAAGGLVRSGPSYTFQQGPDGRAYAVGGEVQLDVSPVAGDPQATIAKAARIRAAALAPSNPSAQDVSVASNAGQLAAKARVDLAVQRREEAQLMLEKVAQKAAPNVTESGAIESAAESEVNQANADASVAVPIDVKPTNVASSDIGSSAKLASEEPIAALNSFLTPSEIQVAPAPVFINQFV